jgi:CRISPR-associated endonuclease/helicase Cas3
MKDSIPTNDMHATQRDVTVFAEQFEALTGFKPMRWQQRLHDENFAKGALPSAVSVPTGLGKTAVMAIWMVALAQQMKSGQNSLPRRLVYVVDRRAVVDQATQFAEDLRANLQKSEAGELRDALGLSKDEALPISTLRGQFVDNRDWLEDPSRPAIIVGTVDMIGSRLLFEGYGVSRKMRPYHAGLLGADTLVLLDEAHLVPPFEALLAEISESADRYGPQDEELGGLLPKFRLLPLSATGRRQTAQPFTLEEKDFRNPDDAIVLERLFAKKRLTLQELGAKKLLNAFAPLSQQRSMGRIPRWYSLRDRHHPCDVAEVSRWSHQLPGPCGLSGCDILREEDAHTVLHSTTGKGDDAFGVRAEPGTWWPRQRAMSSLSQM